MLNDDDVKNVDIKMNGSIATITIDLSKNFGASKSGKSTIVATTAGSIRFPGTDIKLGLNAYK